jgi:hypothetical protein
MGGREVLFISPAGRFGGAPSKTAKLYRMVWTMTGPNRGSMVELTPQQSLSKELEVSSEVLLLVSGKQGGSGGGSSVAKANHG